MLTITALLVSYIVPMDSEGWSRLYFLYAINFEHRDYNAQYKSPLKTLYIEISDHLLR